MSTDKILAVVDRHFSFETPEQIDKVIETYADHVIWEAPARNLYLTDHRAIVAEYRKIIAGISNPNMEVLRRFACNNEAFDDRLVYFTALKGNVWGIEPNKKVKLRLVHYFKVKDDKITHEIGYEMWTS